MSVHDRLELAFTIHRNAQSGVLCFYEAAERRETEQVERGLLARLQEKYAPLPLPTVRRDLFDVPSG